LGAGAGRLVARGFSGPTESPTKVLNFRAEPIALRPELIALRSEPIDFGPELIALAAEGLHIARLFPGLLEPRFEAGQLVPVGLLGAVAAPLELRELRTKL